MSVRVTIETPSKGEAELIARRLPVPARAQTWRGYGVIRLAAKSTQETKELIEAVGRCSREYGLRWARVRYDDEERVFRATSRDARIQSTSKASGSAIPTTR
jgi:hypothetical protein